MNATRFIPFISIRLLQHEVRGHQLGASAVKVTELGYRVSKKPGFRDGPRGSRARGTDAWDGPWERPSRTGSWGRTRETAPWDGGEVKERKRNQERKD